MPKITNQKVHRLHISIPDLEYQQALSLAKENKTSISEIIRITLRLLTPTTSEQIFVKKEKEKEKINGKEIKISNLEF